MKIKKILYPIFMVLQILLVIPTIPFYIGCVVILLVVALPSYLNDKILKYLSDAKPEDTNTSTTKKTKSLHSGILKDGVFKSIDEIINKSEGCNDC